MEPKKSEDWYPTLPATARHTGIGVGTLRKAVANGELTTYDVGGWPRLRWREVRAWIERKPHDLKEGRVRAKAIVDARLARGHRP